MQILSQLDPEGCLQRRYRMMCMKQNRRQSLLQNFNQNVNGKSHSTNRPMYEVCFVIPQLCIPYKTKKVCFLMLVNYWHALSHLEKLNPPFSKTPFQV